MQRKFAHEVSRRDPAFPRLCTTSYDSADNCPTRIDTCLFERAIPYRVREPDGSVVDVNLYQSVDVFKERPTDDAEYAYEYFEVAMLDHTAENTGEHRAYDTNRFTALYATPAELALDIVSRGKLYGMPPDTLMITRESICIGCKDHADPTDQNEDANRQIIAIRDAFFAALPSLDNYN
jgi:hypothetical protein